MRPRAMLMVRTQIKWSMEAVLVQPDRGAEPITGDALPVGVVVVEDIGVSVERRQKKKTN